MFSQQVPEDVLLEQQDAPQSFLESAHWALGTFPYFPLWCLHLGGATPAPGSPRSRRDLQWPREE